MHTVLLGYGCACEEDNTTIGIYYDSIDKSISFYKKGICQGVAFTNVGQNLYPAIDVWFESGTVTMRQEKKRPNLRFM